MDSTSPTVVRVNCGGCGVIELTADQIIIDLAGSYQFTCPTCTRPARRPATPRLVSILLASGALLPLTHGHVAAVVQKIRDASTREILEAAGNAGHTR